MAALGVGERLILFSFLFFYSCLFVQLVNVMLELSSLIGCGLQYFCGDVLHVSEWCTFICHHCYSVSKEKETTPPLHLNVSCLQMLACFTFYWIKEKLFTVFPLLPLQRSTQRASCGSSSQTTSVWHWWWDGGGALWLLGQDLSYHGGLLRSPPPPAQLSCSPVVQLQYILHSFSIR